MILIWLLEASKCKWHQKEVGTLWFAVHLLSVWALGALSGALESTLVLVCTLGVMACTVASWVLKGDSRVHWGLIDPWHVLSFLSSWPIEILYLWDKPWYLWLVAAAGSWLIWQFLRPKHWGPTLIQRAIGRLFT